MSKPPSVYIIAGPNGAGKTTFAKQFLPNFADCSEFVNADLIAGGLSPFDPDKTALQAGRLMLARVKHLAREGADFGFETTLSGRAYAGFFRRLKRKGYKLHLYFLWLENVDLALKRIADRVRQGGHNVEDAVVRRRFQSGLKNLFKLYHPLLDSLVLFDSSTKDARHVATEIKGEWQISNKETFGKVLELAGVEGQ